MDNFCELHEFNNHSALSICIENHKVHERLDAHIARIGVAKFRVELAKFQRIQKAIEVCEVQRQC